MVVIVRLVLYNLREQVDQDYRTLRDIEAVQSLSKRRAIITIPKSREGPITSGQRKVGPNKFLTSLVYARPISRGGVASDVGWAITIGR